MKHKILIVNKMYFPDIGGIETIVKQYAEFLNNHYDVTVLTASASKRFRTQIEYISGVKVLRCPSFGIHFSMPISITLLIKLLFSRRKYDLIHFHEPYPLGSLIGIFPKKSKYVITWHSDIIRQKSLKRIVEFFQKKLCKKADIILSTSPQLIEFSNVISQYKNKVTVLPLSIDIDSYNSPVAECDEEFLLYIGRLSYYKGINVLLNGYEKSNTQTPLYIVGDGDPIICEQINKTIQVSNKKIIFINKYVSETEKRFYLKNCRYLLFPSIYPSEAFGIIQLEAMAYSKPVINTALPTGVPWVSLHNQTGLTVSVGNEEELAQAIDRLSSDELVETLGRNARKRVEDLYTDRIVFKKLHDKYNMILK